jgi:hypothetical protein
MEEAWFYVSKIGSIDKVVEILQEKFWRRVEILFFDILKNKVKCRNAKEIVEEVKLLLGGSQNKGIPRMNTSFGAEME